MRITKSNPNRYWPILLITLSIMLGVQPALSDDQTRVLEWEDLVPEDWNPNSLYDQFTDEEFAAMPDEQYYELQDQMQAMLDEAPTVDALNGKTVRIPGFMLPLEFDETNITEFLLVPYFGACVHTPPPPANQVIHGKLQTEFTTNALFEPVWISGKLKTIRTQKKLGESGVVESIDVDTGYTMDVEEVTPYMEDDQ